MSFQELCSLGPEEVMKFLRSIWAEGVEFEELSPGEQMLFGLAEEAFDRWAREQERH